MSCVSRLLEVSTRHINPETAAKLKLSGSQFLAVLQPTESKMLPEDMQSIMALARVYECSWIRIHDAAPVAKALKRYDLQSKHLTLAEMLEIDSTLRAVAMLEKLRSAAAKD